MVYLHIFTYIYHKNQPNAGIYTIHGAYGSGKFRRVRVERVVLFLETINCVRKFEKKQAGWKVVSKPARQLETKN